MMAELHAQMRQQAKKPKWTTLMIVESQAVKITCNASTDSKLASFKPCVLVDDSS
jgi:hypothetical protein